MYDLTYIGSTDGQGMQKLLSHFVDRYAVEIIKIELLPVHFV